MEHSKYYEKYAERYARGGCTKEQLQKLVALGILTQEEYDEIVGVDEAEETVTEEETSEAEEE